jgi:hypothetical protein
MRNISAYIGFTVVSDNEDGTKRVSNHKGLDYHGLDDLQIVVLEDALTEFAEEYDELQRRIDKRMIELGYGIAALTALKPGEVENLQSVVEKGKIKK